MTTASINPGSLSARLLSMIGGVALVAVVCIIAFAHQRERAATLARVEDNARLFGSALAHASIGALEDRSGVRNPATLLSHIVREPSIRSVALLDLDGTVRAQAGRTVLAAPSVELRAQALSTRAETLAMNTDARTLRVLIPLPSRAHQAQLGLLFVELDISQPLAELWRGIWWTALAGLVVLAFTMVLLYFLITRMVVRPVGHLAGQAMRLGSGDLGVRSGLTAASAASRELYQLATAFDAMAVRMQESEEVLEQRARERTRELESAVAELESFSYAVSHDLRSPLRSIDGFALILAEKLGAQIDEQARGYIERVREQAQYMGGLIDNLLTLTHVSRADLERVRVDLTAIATDSAAALRRADPQREVDIVIQPAMQADADPQLLRVALSQLLENAWKFTRDQPHPRIEVGISTVHNRAAAFVRDNGVGFDPAYVERLFTPFRRLHSPREFAGTGIGLAIVQRVIQRHGGQIWAESEPGKGATFWFTLAGHE